MRKVAWKKYGHSRFGCDSEQGLLILCTAETEIAAILGCWLLRWFGYLNIEDSAHPGFRVNVSFLVATFGEDNGPAAEFQWLTPCSCQAFD